MNNYPFGCGLYHLFMVMWGWFISVLTTLVISTIKHSDFTKVETNSAIHRHPFLSQAANQSRAYASRRTLSGHSLTCEKWVDLKLQSRDFSNKHV